jgi:hypothetical protein
MRIAREGRHSCALRHVGATLSAEWRIWAIASPGEPVTVGTVNDIRPCNKGVQQGCATRVRLGEFVRAKDAAASAVDQHG